MRLLSACSLAFAGAVSALVVPGAGAVASQHVPASVWAANPYFVGNNPALTRQPAFIVDDKAKFDSIFHYAATQGGPPPLDMAVFATKTLLGVAEAGQSICSSTLVSVTRTGSAYVVRYTQRCPPPSRTRYVVPFAVWVPKAPIASVTFVRNGRVRAVVKGP